MTVSAVPAPVLPVLLSGGSGTRLWPMSRTLYPKQLLPLASDQPMLAETAARFQATDLFTAPMVICNEEHRFVVAEQLRQIGVRPRSIVLEPVGRNTAPAAAVAAMMVEADQPGGLLLLAPSDAVIRDVPAFHAAVRAAVPAAQAGALVTFGVTPTGPETAYGYIRYGAEAVSDGVFRVERFVEKPDLATARSYLAEGCYAWNAGLFLFRADVFLAELARTRPDILDGAREALDRSLADLDFLRLNRDAFGVCPSESIDYAVMEQTDRAAVVPVTMGWNDVGAWSALWDITAKDEAGNVAIGDIVTEDVQNSYLRSSHRLLTAVGIRDLVVIVTDDAVMVAPRDRAQDVKKIVDQLKRAGRSEADSHSIVYRPWGSYQSIDAGERFQVKRIVVKPGAKLSMQMHHHRAEHWVVVHGTAKVVRDEEETLIFENQSIYIPIGARHRLENPGKVPLHLIEVQSGSYLGEDDIVRFEDVYGRK